MKERIAVNHSPSKSLMDRRSDYPGYKIIREDWCEFYRRNPARFIEEYLDIRLTIFQKMLLTIVSWKRGKKK